MLSSGPVQILSIPHNPAGADKSEGVLGVWGDLKNLHSAALLACKAGPNFFNALKSKTSCFRRIYVVWFSTVPVLSVLDVAANIFSPTTIRLGPDAKRQVQSL